MKKALVIILICFLIICIGVELGIIINQQNIITTQQDEISNYIAKIEEQEKQLNEINDQKHEELAEKVIIQIYHELVKAGSKKDNEPVGLIKENVEIVSDSYSGNDKDIKDMLEKVKGYINFGMDTWHKISRMTEEEKKKFNSDSFDYYMTAKSAVDKCISKYALFDKIGLYE